MAERLSLTLETYLDLIPEEFRHRLDHKLEEDGGLVRIARSITDWQIVANFLPGVDDQDVSAIQHDHLQSLDLQKTALLKKWKVRNGHLSTYRQLARSLFEAGAVDSVHTVCQELGAPRNPSAYSTPSQPLYHTPAPVTAEERVAGYLNNAMDHPRPQLSSLVTTLNELSWSDVKQMTIHLDKCLDLALLADIEQEYPIEECLLYTMKAWLERDCEASWAKVVYALRMSKQNILAMKIEAMYCTIQKHEKSASSPDPTPEVIFPTTEPQLNTQSQPATSSSTYSSGVIPTSTASPMPACDPSAAHLRTYNSECHSTPGEAAQLETFVTWPSDYSLVTPLEKFEQFERDREASWAKVVYALRMLWHQGRQLISQFAIRMGFLMSVAVVMIVLFVALSTGTQGGVVLLYTYVPKIVVSTAVIAIAAGGAITAATKAPTIKHAVLLYGVAAAEVVVLALYEASTDEGIRTASVVLGVGIVISVAVAEASRRGTPAAPRARAVVIAAVAGVAGTGAAAAVGTAAEVRGAIAVAVTGATGVAAAAVVAAVAATTGRGGAAARAGPVVIAAVAAAAGTGASAAAAGAGITGAGAAVAVVVGAGIAPWFIPMTAVPVGTVIGAELAQLFMPITAAAVMGAGVVGAIAAIAARADSKPLEAIAAAVAVGAIALAAASAAEPTITTANRTSSSSSKSRSWTSSRTINSSGSSSSSSYSGNWTTSGSNSSSNSIFLDIIHPNKEQNKNCKKCEVDL